MNHILDAALNYAKHGVRVFPIRPNEKIPPEGFMWKTSATSNPDTIRKWFGPGGKFEGHNLAGVMGEASPAGGFLFAVDLDYAIDADGKVLKDGAQTLAKHCEERGIPWPWETWAQTTPRGGGHVIFRTTRPMRNAVNRSNLSGVDARAQGGYILLAPSQINGKSYATQQAIVDGIAQMPAGLEAFFEPAGDGVDKPAGEKRKPGRPKGSTSKVDPKRAQQRAIEYLQKAPLSIRGNGGDNTAYKVACGLRDLGCSAQETLDLMFSEHWDRGCGWSYQRLEEKVRNAFRYAREEEGSRAPEAVFDKVESEDPDQDQDKQKSNRKTFPHPDAPESPLRELNKRHALVAKGEGHAILEEGVDEAGIRYMRFMREATFKAFYGNRTFPDPIGTKIKTLGEAYLRWPNRREYRKVTFAPEQAVPADTLNLWTGWGVKPAPGDWSLMRFHIRDVICSGNDTLANYVLGWIAHAVQRPWETGKVALVLRGGRGCGKGTLGHWLHRIFGNHAVYISRGEHMTGRFNAHLRAAAFLFCDEAYFPGDPRHTSTLKSLITEPTMMVEYKGIDAIEVENRLSIFMASNEAFVVPAGLDERRFCVIDAGSSKTGDRKYFDDLYRVAGSGGVEAMLYDMLRMDLTSFDVRSVPSTRALDEQKLGALGSVDRYLWELTEGDDLPGWDKSAWTEEGPLVLKSRFHEEYLERCRKRYNERYPKDHSAFWRHVYDRMGPLKPKRDASGERAILLPPVSEAKALMRKALGLSPDFVALDAIENFMT